ncbi:MAG: hypothetical protein ACOYN4_22020 [Bacteroidales bacterium]
MRSLGKGCKGYHRAEVIVFVVEGHFDRINGKGYNWLNDRISTVSFHITTSGVG